MIRPRALAVSLVVVSCFGVQAEEPSLKAELLKQETRLIDAIKHKDHDTLKKMLAEQHYSIDAHGRLATPDVLPLLAETTIEKYNVSDVRAFVAGEDVGILTYKYVWSGTEHGVEIKDSTSYATSVWAKRDGQWKSIFYQDTPIGNH